MSGWTKIVRFIPIADAAMWRACGWRVEPMDCHHGRHSVMVWRWG